MSVSILEALYNAEANINNAIAAPALAHAVLPLAKGQLHNAIVLLEKGYGLEDEVDELLRLAFGDVEDVPHKKLS